MRRGLVGDILLSGDLVASSVFCPSLVLADWVSFGEPVESSTLQFSFSETEFCCASLPLVGSGNSGVFEINFCSTLDVLIGLLSFAGFATLSETSSLEGFQIIYGQDHWTVNQRVRSENLTLISEQ